MSFHNRGTITIESAQSRLPKEGHCIIISHVRWDDYEPTFVSLSPLSPEVAVPPRLPRGYEVEPHDSWVSFNRASLRVAVQFNQSKRWESLYDFDLAIESILKEAKSLGIRLHHFCEISFPDLPAYDQDPEYYKYWQWRRINEDLALLSGNDLAEALDQKIWTDSDNLIAVLRDDSEVPLRDCKTIGNVHHLKVPILHQRGKEDPVTLEYF